MKTLSNWQMAISQTLFTAKVVKDAKEKGELVFAARSWRCGEEIFAETSKASTLET